MNEYLLNVDMELYGPYHSEEQARFAEFLFISKHPDMKDNCSVVPFDCNLEYALVFEPKLLH